MSKAAPRILIICGATRVYGKEIIALELGQGLAQRGQAVSFIVNFWNDGDFLDRLKRLGIPTQILPMGVISATFNRECLRMSGEAIWRLPGLLVAYSRVLRRLRPEKIIHTDWHSFLLIFPFLRPERDLFWVHDIVPEHARYRRVFGWFERRLGCFVCVSHAVAESLRRIGISEHKIRVIHNGLADPAGTTDPAQGAQRTIPDRDRGAGGALEGPRRFIGGVCAGSTAAFLGGAPHLRRRRTCVQDKAKDKVGGVAQWRTMGLLATGFEPDRHRIYGDMDVCVVPSRFQEPLGMAAVEPGFFGKPAIVTRRGGLPEIVENGVNGLLVEAERPAEIADALSRLIEQPALREFLGRNARERALELFGRDRFVADFVSLLAAEGSK